MSEQILLSIAPIVSLMVLVGIVGIYFSGRNAARAGTPD